MLTDPRVWPVCNDRIVYPIQIQDSNDLSSIQGHQISQKKFLLHSMYCSSRERKPQQPLPRYASAILRVLELAPYGILLKALERSDKASLLHCSSLLIIETRLILTADVSGSALPARGSPHPSVMPDESPMLPVFVRLGYHLPEDGQVYTDKSNETRGLNSVYH